MALNSIKVKKEQKMNWIKENKIRIIMIAVALLAVIGTVIVVTRRSGKAQTTDNNQSDVDYHSSNACYIHSIFRKTSKSRCTS